MAFIGSTTKKNIKLFGILLMFFLFIVITASNNNSMKNGDFAAYHALYNHFLFGGDIENVVGYTTEIGYMVIMYAISKLGLSYNMFLIIISLISLVLFTSTIKKITNNYTFVILCYSIFPFVYDAIQIRFFFAYSIIVYALNYILFQEKKNIFKYILFVLFASTIHTASIFYLIFLLTSFKFKKIIKISFIISIMLTFISLVTNINVVEFLFSIFKYNEFEKYTNSMLSYQVSVYTSLFVMILMIFFLLLVRYIWKNNYSFMTEKIYQINLILAVLYPLTLISLDFERLFRPILIINYALIAANRVVFGKKYLMIVCCIILVLTIRLVPIFDYVKLLYENNNLLGN